jgi:biopolymer transport protein ExbB/TolQ
MLIVATLSAVVAISLAVAIVALRALERELEALRARAAKLVRLSVAVDDLHHETTQVVPAYRSAVTRARTLRRTEDGEGPR